MSRFECENKFCVKKGKIMNRKIIALILSVSAAVSLISGCGDKSEAHEWQTQSAVGYSSSEDAVSSSVPEPVRVLPNRPRVLDTKSEEFVRYATGVKELSYNGFEPYLYDFRTRMSVGYSLHDTNNQLSVEADYGLIGRLDGSALNIKAYDHTDDDLYITEAFLEALDLSCSLKEELPLDKNNTSVSTDLNSDPNGLYRISAAFSNQTRVDLYYLINGDEYCFCQMTAASENASSYTGDNYRKIPILRSRRENMNKLIDEWKITPENSLDVDIIKYPCRDYVYKGKLIWRCETDKWASLSDELVDPGWSDERKAYVICDWMSQNLAYDYYVSDVIKTDRSYYNHAFTGEYSVWATRCGVCRDFGQILAIMLRKQGIPAEVIANKTHIWNIVYLNGRWMEVDICATCAYDVKTADHTVREPNENNYDGLLNMPGPGGIREKATSVHKYLYMGQDNFEEDVVPAA